MSGQPLQNLPDSRNDPEYRELHLAVQQLMQRGANSNGIGYNAATATAKLRVKLLEPVFANAALHITTTGEARLATAADVNKFCNGFASSAGTAGSYVVALLSGSLVTAQGSWLGLPPGVTSPIASTNLPARAVQWLGNQVNSNTILFQFTPPTQL